MIATSVQARSAPDSRCFGCGPANEQGLRIESRPGADGELVADGDRVTVEASIEAGGRTTATCRGTFVAVPPGHPASGRW